MTFPTTQWSELAHATLHGDAAGQDALGAMCEAYRKPVEAFIATRGYRGAELEDLVQEFFLRWLRSRAWKRADRVQGKFRTFLLGAVQHLLAHHRENTRRQKRGGGQVPASLEELAESGFQVADLSDPAAPEFDRRWAVTVVENALAHIAREFAARDKSAEFEILRRFLPGSAAAMTMDEAGHALGLNVNAVKAAIHRLRARFREVLRAAVAATVSAPHEVEEELRYLRSLLLENAASEMTRNSKAEMGKEERDES
jgi:DNA-directed RNA polymerase specialized sigma24 family protein